MYVLDDPWVLAVGGPLVQRENCVYRRGPRLHYSWSGAALFRSQDSAAASAAGNEVAVRLSQVPAPTDAEIDAAFDAAFDAQH